MVNNFKLRYKYTPAIENQRNNIWAIIRQSNKFSCQSVNFLPVDFLKEDNFRNKPVYL